MDIIKAVEEIGFKKFPRGERYHQKGIILSLSETGDGITISTSKRRSSALRIDTDHWVFGISELQIPSAIRAIVRFWAKNGVKLGEKK